MMATKEDIAFWGCIVCSTAWAASEVPMGDLMSLIWVFLAWVVRFKKWVP